MGTAITWGREVKSGVCDSLQAFLSGSERSELSCVGSLGGVYPSLPYFPPKKKPAVLPGIDYFIKQRSRIVRSGLKARWQEELDENEESLSPKKFVGLIRFEPILAARDYSIYCTEA